MAYPHVPDDIDENRAACSVAIRKLPRITVVRRPVRLTALLLLSAACLAPGHARATLSTDLQRGEKVVDVPVAGRNPEICVIPKHFAGGEYSDRDSKVEAKLCTIDGHTNAAVCPKLNSSNPGLDFYSVPEGSTPDQVAAAHCDTDGAKKIAKYKLSSSCSYTPSILGYYHVSRMLGGIADVPPAVLRTFDLKNHIALGRKALAATKSGSLIRQTWAGLMAQLTAGSKAKRKDVLLTDDFSQSYGALSENPRKEDFYKEFFNGGRNNVARARSFRDNNPIVRLLARNADIGSLVGRDFTTENVQKMVQLKDAADMIVIDTLMNQQDRFGNIHYLMTYYYRDADDRGPDGSARLKTRKSLTSEEAARLGAVEVKTMLLKDNDCGVTKDNIARQAGLADRIAHIDPGTYRGILHFDAIADSAETREFFVRELAFTDGDYASVRKNLKELAAKLHQACAKGRLKLDLDLQAHFSAQPLKPRKCDL